MRRQDGVVAIWFAMLLPLLAILSLGVLDISHQSSARSKLQDTIDGATLAAARSNSNSDRELQQVGATWMDVNLRSAPDIESVASSFTLDGVRVVGTATAKVSPFIANLWLNGDMTIEAKSEVVRASNNVEVALVLDITGSMGGQKIRDLKVAAKDLVDLVVQPVQTPYYSKMALVPYSIAVNVGSYANRVRGTPTNGTCSYPGCKKYKFRNPWNQNRTFSISNCVTPRTGSYAFTDAAPSNKFLGENYPSSSNGCPSSTITPLTSNRTTLKDEIDDLDADGTTAGQIGLAWGWYMVSPNFAYLWPTSSQPAAYGTEHLLKVVVLMTDGEFNTTYCNGVVSKDSNSGGDSDHINCNASNGSAFSQSQALCANMKAAGILVYTVGFDVGNNRSASDLMAECATDSSHVFLASGGGDLQDAFQTIGQDINSLRLSR